MPDVFGSASLKAVKQTRGKPVALVGFGPSMAGYKQLPAFVPVWSLLDAESYGVERVNLALEIHPKRDLVLEGQRWIKLREGTPYPVYMMEADERFPSSVAYPLEQVQAACFSNIFVGLEPAKYLDSSFPYLLALAVLEGHNPIFVYGFEFRSDTEYSYQRVGAALMIGWAAGRGVSVVLPENNSLLPPTLYGYEDYQMISRQNLEQFRVELVRQESDWLGKLNVAHTQVTERGAAVNKNVGPTLEEARSIQAAEDARLEAHKQAYMCEGAIQAISHLIDLCDRKEAALQAFEDNIFVAVPDQPVG